MNEEIKTTAELVRKLRARVQHNHVAGDKWSVIPDPLCQAAANMIESLAADVEGAAHNRFYDQADAYFEGVKDQRNAN